MKLIIDIDDELVETARFAVQIDMGSDYVKSIANGTPLDNLRAEIEQNAYPIVHGVNNHEKGMTLYGILQVIDKYKAEIEPKESEE